MQERTGIRVIYTVGAQTYQVDFRAAIINRPVESGEKQGVVDWQRRRIFDDSHSARGT